MLNKKLCSRTRIHNYSISLKSISNLSLIQKYKPPPVLSTYKITKESTSSTFHKNSETRATDNLTRLSNTLNFYPKYINTQPNTKVSTFICTSPNESSVNENNNTTQFNIEYLNPFDRCSLTIKTLHINTKQHTCNYVFNDRPNIMKHHRRYIKSFLSKNTSLKKMHYKLASGDDLAERVDKLFHRNKKYEDELKDKVDITEPEYKSLHQTIRYCLVNDINPLQSLLLKNDNFYKQKENKVNFLEDVLLCPHLQNNFLVRKNNNELKELLASPNCLSKMNHLSLDKERRKKMFIKDYEKKTKKSIISYLQHNADDEERKFYEKYKHEFNEFFTKRNLYKKVEITRDNKARKLFFESNVNHQN